MLIHNPPKPLRGKWESKVIRLQANMINKMNWGGGGVLEKKTFLINNMVNCIKTHEGTKY